MSTRGSNTHSFIGRSWVCLHENKVPYVVRQSRGLWLKDHHLEREEDKESFKGEGGLLREFTCLGDVSQQHCGSL